MIIDDDIRHGFVSLYVNSLSDSEGLANLSCRIIDRLRLLLSKIQNVRTYLYFTVGKMPSNFTELLETPKFKILIEDLKSQYDYIIIDCPSIEVVPMPDHNRYADRSVFIVCAGLLEHSMILELDYLYQEKKLNDMAFVLTGTSGAGGCYGYSYASNTTITIAPNLSPKYLLNHLVIC